MLGCAQGCGSGPRARPGHRRLAQKLLANLARYLADLRAHYHPATPAFGGPRLRGPRRTTVSSQPRAAVEGEFGRGRPVRSI